MNTIIVEDADHMGLSQLYQLRGRGPLNRLAYARFLYKRDRSSPRPRTATAGHQDFTELGSRSPCDLEIRAGNILGRSSTGSSAWGSTSMSSSWRKRQLGEPA